MPNAIRVPSLTVQEVDGAPSVAGVETLVVSNGTLTDNGSGSVTLTTGGGGGGSAHTIKDNGTSLTARTGLNFIGRGFQVVDDSAGDETEIRLFDPRTSFLITDTFLSGSTTGGNIGQNGWWWVNGSTSHAAASTGQSGFLRRATGATSGTHAYTYLSSINAGVIVPTSKFRMGWLARLNDTADTTSRLGLTDNISGNPPANGIYVERLTTDAAANWYAVTRAASTHTRTDTGVAVNTTDPQMLEVHYDGTSMIFSINGSVVATHTTNLPTAGMDLWASIVNAAAASKSLDLSTMYLYAYDLTRY